VVKDTIIDPPEIVRWVAALEGDMLIDLQEIEKDQYLYLELFAKIIEKFKMKLEIGIIDYRNIDAVNKQIKEYIQIPYTKHLFKEKTKLRLNFAENAERTGIRLNLLQAYHKNSQITLDKIEQLNQSY
jgi:hypothetical protein